MIKSFRAMLLPNDKQKTRLHETASAARYAYNWAVGKQTEAFAATGKYVPESDIRKMFTLHKKEKPWLGEVSNNATKQALKDACGAFWRFAREKKKPGYKPYSKKKLARAARLGLRLGRHDMAHHPKFKKKGKAEPKFYVDTDNIEFTETHVLLEKIAAEKKGQKRSRVRKLNSVRLAQGRVKPEKRVPLEAKYSNPRVKFDGINWWVSVGVETAPCGEEPAGEGIGVDVGISRLAVESNGTAHRNINKDLKVRKLKKRQRRLQRGVSRKYIQNREGERYRKTCNIARSETELLKLHMRLTGIRHNHAHQATSGIMRQKPRFVVAEDLNVQGMMKNRHLSKAIQEQGWGEFVRQLEYKSALNGIRFVKASRTYPSSKLCSGCGIVRKDLKLSERTYRCGCGLVIDRDLNAAINLRNYAA